MRFFSHSKTINCPIDGKPKEVFYNRLDVEGLQLTRFFGCETDMHGGTTCSKCASQIIVEPLVDPLLQSKKIYRPYEE